MKYEKIYQEVVKQFVKYENGKEKRSVLHQKVDGIHYITMDGYIAYAIHEHFFPFDGSKLHFAELKRCFEGAEELPDIIATGEMQKRDKGNVVKIGNKWVNEKYLKYFDNPTFAGNENPFHPVIVKELGAVVGIICPVNIGK